MIIGIPKDDPAEIGGGKATAGRLPSEGADRFGGGTKGVMGRAISVEQSEVAAGGSGKNRGRRGVC